MKKPVQFATRKDGKTGKFTTITVDTRCNPKGTAAVVRANAERIFHDTLPARIDPKVRRALT